ncbi:S26 family signal peptidase [Nannocystaceae bacterium ST9]
MFRRPDDEPARPTRSTSARVAWVMLLGLGAVVFARASLATVVQVHGDGMAPTILDAESVLMVRGTWGIERGDIVVYDPTPPSEPTLAPEPEPTPRRSTPGPLDRGRNVDPDRKPRGELRNTAVVEVDEVEANWDRVRSADDDRPRGYRVGRVLACPGDTVTFHVPDVALGLLVNGTPIAQKAGETIELAFAAASPKGAHEREAKQKRATAWETLGDTRYPILAGSTPTSWPGIGLPDDLGALEIQAEGYLVLADNRDEGACCDSRVLGWIPAEKVRGEVVLRLTGESGERGMQWLP